MVIFWLTSSEYRMSNTPCENGKACVFSFKLCFWRTLRSQFNFWGLHTKCQVAADSRCLDSPKQTEGLFSEEFELRGLGQKTHCNSPDTPSNLIGCNIQTSSPSTPISHPIYSTTIHTKSERKHIHKKSVLT